MAQVPSNLIPTTVTQLATDPTPSENGVMMYVRDGVNYKVRVGDLLSVSGVPTSRNVLAGTALSGGGPLSSDVTLSVAPKAIGLSQLDDTGVTSGSYGNSGYTPVITIDSTGRITAASLAPITSESGGTVKSVDVSGGSTGLTTSGGPITGEGTITLAGTLGVGYGGTGATDAAGARANLSAAVTGANNDITSMSAVSGGISSPQFVQIDTAATPTIALGKVRWNQTTNTVSFGIIDGTQEVNIGQQMYAYVTNAEAVTITKGQAVYLFEATGNRATVKLALNTGDSTSAKTLGLAAQDITSGQSGFVMTQGVLDKLNTSAFAEGATLYLGATAGSLTVTKPQAPNHMVYIGVVERSNAGNGQIYVKPQNGYELDELHDVKITSVANNQLLQYDNTIPAWKNVNPSAVSIGTATNIAGGAASQIVYQSGAGATGFIANGTAGDILKSAGASVPAWSTPGALTKTDDTNVTLTLGGSASTALVNAASITVGWSGTLAATRGGTGTGTYAVGDILYASTTSALSRLADVATGNALISGGVNTAPSWGKIGLTTHVSGTLPIANGGTNATATPTAGGSAYGTGTAYAFTAAGTAGQVLVSNGASAPTWGAVSGGTF